MTERFPWDDDMPQEADLLSKRELCEIAGFVPKQVDSFVRAGMPSVAGPSSRSPIKFVLKDCIAWLVQRRETPDDPLTQARAEKNKAEAERLKRMNAVADGDLISRAQKEAEIEHGMARLRVHLLSIPERLTQFGADVRNAVKLEIEDGINELVIE